jgi:DNA excision repair protein ERCC-3
MDYALAEPNDKYRVGSTARSKLAVVRQLADMHADDHVLVIGQYVEQLELLAGYLNAPLITGRTPNRERVKLYEAFRSGEIRRLVVSKVANFSIDLPDANVAIQVSGTFGSRQEEAQRLGRVLRPKSDGSRARFYTVVSRDTNDVEYAQRRQRFLAEQGYAYQLVDADKILGGVAPDDAAVSGLGPDPSEPPRLRLIRGGGEG